MEIKITKASNLSNIILQKSGFSKMDSKLITKNLIDAQLADRKSHGLVRLLEIKSQLFRLKINTGKEKVTVIRESSTSLLIDAKKKPGVIPIYQSLDIAVKKVKKHGMIAVGIKNATLFSGFIGSYARQAVENDLIFIGFNNADGLVPYGSRKKLWGTNPITIGIPANGIPVILDMASSKITWGEVLIAVMEGKKIKEETAVDIAGNLTTDPKKAIKGGLLPIAGHKGSGLAFIVELLAGVLTGSRRGFSESSRWGTFYILIDPALFRPIKQFKNDVGKAIRKLKNLPKAKGFSEIYFPGEKSNKFRKKLLQSGKININNKLYCQLQKLISGRCQIR